MAKNTLKVLVALNERDAKAYELLRKIVTEQKHKDLIAHFAGADHKINGASPAQNAAITAMQAQIKKLVGPENAGARASILDAIAAMESTTWESAMNVVSANKGQASDHDGEKAIPDDSVCYVPFPRIERGSFVSAHYVWVQIDKANWHIASVDLVSRHAQIVLTSEQVNAKLAQGKNANVDHASKARQVCACLHKALGEKAKGLPSVVHAFTANMWHNCGGYGTPNGYMWGNGIMLLGKTTGTAMLNLITNERSVPKSFDYIKLETVSAEE